MVLKAWMRLLRIPNLIIIAVCQVLVYLHLIRPNIETENASLNSFEFLLLSLTTILLAASAYLINNIIDRNIDANYPEYTIIPEIFSLKFCWTFYALLLMAGAAIAFYLSRLSGQHNAYILFPLAAISLALYSTSLKCKPIVGNLFVALFTSLLILVIPYAYYEDLVLLKKIDFRQWKEISFIFFLLSSFSFITNFIRELVKDMEDAQADAVQACRSTANYFGIHKTRIIVIAFWFLLLFYIFYSLSIIRFNLYNGLSAMVLIILCLYISYILILPVNQHSLKKLSKLLKILMISGMLYGLLYSL